MPQICLRWYHADGSSGLVMDAIKCPGCGATGNGLVCCYCGSRMRDGADEALALAEYHGLLKAETGDKRAKLLKHGYLPSSEAGLIEAGFNCLPLFAGNLHSDEEEAAAARLDAIIARLKVSGSTPQSARAITEFEAGLTRYRRSARQSTLLGCVILSVAALLVLGFVLWMLLG